MKFIFFIFVHLCHYFT